MSVYLSAIFLVLHRTGSICTQSLHWTLRHATHAHLKRWQPAVECLWQSPSGSGHTSPCPAPGSTGSALQAVHFNRRLFDLFEVPVLQLPVPVPSVITSTGTQCCENESGSDWILQTSCGRGDDPPPLEGQRFPPPHERRKRKDVHHQEWRKEKIKPIVT